MVRALDEGRLAGWETVGRGKWGRGKVGKGMEVGWGCVRGEREGGGRGVAVWLRTETPDRLLLTSCLGGDGFLVDDHTNRGDGIGDRLWLAAHQ